MNAALKALGAATLFCVFLGCQPSSQRLSKEDVTLQVVYPIEQGGNYGLMDATGKELVSPRYEFASGAFTDVRITSLDWLVGQTGAMLINDDEWFFHDGTGLRQVQPLIDDYRFSANLGDGLFLIYSRTNRKEVDTLGAVPTLAFDPSGRWQPKSEFLPRRPMSEGNVVVSDGKRSGYANREGDLVIPLQFEHCEAFRDGMAAVRVDGLWGFINRSGDMVIEPAFEAVSWYDRGTALAKDRLSGKVMLIDQNGDQVESDLSKVVLHEGFQAGFSEGLLLVSDDDGSLRESSSEPRLFHYIDIQGNRVSEPPLLQSGPARRFSTNAAIVERLSSDGSEHIALVRRDDLSLREIPSASWTPFKFGLSSDRSGKLGYIDETGQRRGPVR